MYISNSVSEIFEQVLRVGPGDVLFGISFPRYSKRTLSAMKYARDRGARVIALTDSQLSPLARVADHVLLARSDMASFVDSLVAPLSVINALIVAVGMSRRDEIEQTFNKLERIWEEYDVYEPAKNGSSKGRGRIGRSSCRSKAKAHPQKRAASKAEEESAEAPAEAKPKRTRKATQSGTTSAKKTQRKNPPIRRRNNHPKIEVRI